MELIGWMTRAVLAVGLRRRGRGEGARPGRDPDFGRRIRCPRPARRTGRGPAAGTGADRGGAAPDPGHGGRRRRARLSPAPRVHPGRRPAAPAGRAPRVPLLRSGVLRSHRTGDARPQPRPPGHRCRRPGPGDHGRPAHAGRGGPASRSRGRRRHRRPAGGRRPDRLLPGAAGAERAHPRSPRRARGSGRCRTRRRGRTRRSGDAGRAAGTVVHRARPRRPRLDDRGAGG